MNDFLNGALTLMPDKLVVGTRSLSVTSITCKQKINLGGKLETDLLKLCELVSEGDSRSRWNTDLLPPHPLLDVPGISTRVIES